ncbi:unnamed protein product [Blepharisma stoltei]|uniref:Large ribosomal subunit protein uL15/eL18 domain-containing protein n=1 Tax=Blepharisma stoltei TaxID=1481888 RepID=A0AAU9ID56_9CILI|nr:unnamed protein product [Blepharisma stoltei]
MLSLCLKRFFGVAPAVQSIISANTLADNPGARKQFIRVGRGEGSKHGGTCGRGNKGDKHRAGGGVKRQFEGGQKGLTRRLPKWGFNRSFFKDTLKPLSFSHLYYFISKGRIDTTKTITMKDLFEAGVFSRIKDGVKLTARGFNLIDRPLHFDLTDATPAAIKAVNEKGGSVMITYRTKKQLEYHVKPYKFDLPMRESAMPPPYEVLKLEKKREIGAMVKYVKPTWIDSWKPAELPKIPPYVRKPKPLVVRTYDYGGKP